jgi:hypothetical protein
MAAGQADSRQPLKETAMFSSSKSIHKSPREDKIVFRNTLVYWSEYRESGRKVGALKLGIFSTLFYEGSGLSIRDDGIPYKQFFGPVFDYACLIWISATRTHACKMHVVEQRDLEFAISHIVMLVTSKFRRIWGSNFPPSTPKH